MDIYIREVASRGNYEAFLNGECIVTPEMITSTPLLTAARILQARGVPGDTPLAMWRLGKTEPDMRTTVREAAALRLGTDTNGMPRLQPYQPAAPAARYRTAA